MVDNMKVKNKILENTRYDQLFSVETANRLVLNGIPFRDAYRQVAMSLKDGSYKAEKNIRHIHTGSIGDPANEKIREKMEQALSRILLKD